MKTVVGGLILSRSLQAIRRKRNLSVQEAASAMGMALRTYEAFEGGRGPQTVERIFAFADATDCDPYALMFGPMFELPDLALACADTKLCLINMMYLREFAADEGEDLTFLDPANLIGGFTRVFREFSDTLSDSERFLKKWLDGKPGYVGLKTLRLRNAKREPPKE